MGEIPQQQLNGVVVRIPEGPQPQGGSSRVFGLEVGPSPLSHPAYQQYLQSPLVDVNREYRYPEKYTWLLGCGVYSAFSVAMVYLVGRALPADVSGLLSLGAVVSGCVFCVANLCYCLQVEPSPPLPLSRRELRHLVGRAGCTVYSLLLWVVGLGLNALSAPRGELWLSLGCYVFISLAALAILVPSWALANKLTAEPIMAGMLTSMFWSGAIFSTSLAGIFNTALLVFWTRQDAECNPSLPVGKDWPWGPASGACVAKATLEWILTPGIVEETLKFVVLWRLVTSLEEAVHSAALTRFPRTSTMPGFPCCGWFLKLAPSPVVLVLAGMAVGAGFSTMENVQYIRSARPVVLRTGSLGPAAVRVFAASLHICMTGTCAFFLAIGRFSPRKSLPVRFVGFALMVVCHGVYDAFCTFSATLNLQQCFTRVVCDTDGQCGFDRAGTLARCTCHYGDVDPGSRKCEYHAASALNGTEHSAQALVWDASGTPRSEYHAASALDGTEHSARALVWDASGTPRGEYRAASALNGTEHSARALVWDASGTPKGGSARAPNSPALPLLLSAQGLVRDPFDASGTLEAALPSKVFQCPEDGANYVCGPSIVSWWPGPWTPFAFGSVVILFFAALGCVALPRVERGHRSRRAAVARGAAEMEVSASAVAA